MAYLSNTDEDEQNKQSQGSGSFNAFGGGDQSQGQNGGSNGSDLGLGKWMGGGPSSGGGASDASADANAKGYQQTYAGDDNKDAKGQAKPNAGASFAQAPMQQGLSGGGQGTGFINFDNYEKNNASQAGTITAAGQKVIGGEDANLTTAEAPVKAGIAGRPTSSPGSTQGDVDNTVEGLLTNPPAGSAGGGIGAVGGTRVGTGGGSGANVTPPLYGTDDGVKTIAGWMNGDTVDGTVTYKQTDDYTKHAPELTETPITGGQTKPSVVDYLAKDQIAQGGYSQGDRMLDGSLISGDVAAQKAIADNQALDKKLQDRVTTEIPAIKKQADDANTQTGQTSAQVTQALIDTDNKLKATIQAATDAYNKNPSPETLANEQAAVKAYTDWFNHGGQEGGTWTQTGGAGTAATAVVTPAQAQEADTIYKLQHPGDNDPTHLPYPDPQHPGGGSQASTYGGTGTGFTFTPPTSPYDPGDGPVSKTNPNGVSGTDGITQLTNHNLTTNEKYNLMMNDPKWWGHAQNDLTPAEIAAMVMMHPETAAFYPKPSPQDDAQAAAMLQWMTDQYKQGVQTVGGSHKPNDYTSLIANLKAAVKSGQKSPYDYAKSLGMTDAQIAAMGIEIPGGSMSNTVHGGGKPGTVISNLK